jgi:hypothetical protein
MLIGCNINQHKTPTPTPTPPKTIRSKYNIKSWALKIQYNNE